jgi:effector-binding domain-containing protein
MNVEIITDQLSLDRMWQVVRANKLENKGLNIWVYEQDHKVFAGVELTSIPGQDTGLELKSITLSKYARYKHIGPYNLIKQAGQNMTDELKSKGYETTLPYIEIYGHWASDETKLETDLLMALK